ncbi:MAG: GIY-YIG nuclease family protein, partial [Bacteroidaceae bacterium]|nr:GIY-YIG nuclease family protein [Bacteroidaceae bacterium]
MSKPNFFPARPETNPIIYGYIIPNSPKHEGWIKIGDTTRTAVVRIKEQLKTAAIPYKIVFEESAMRSDGSSFRDHRIHDYLRKHGYENPEGEWFRCTVNQLRAAMHAVREGVENEENRSCTFGMRPEQEVAVSKTMQYFNSFEQENEAKTPHFLWNAKMRFGKTFASYQLAKQMGWTKVLVLTFKP